MFALRVSYLTGRVYSAEFEDGDDKRRPEWPPHPSRLFSAMVSAWGESGGDPELLPALEWVEHQEPPRIAAGECSLRQAVRHFVPVNDEVSLPEHRPRKGRSFPSGSPVEPEVWFIWEKDLPDALRQPMQRVLDRTSALGHSSSLIEVSMAEPPQDLVANWVPDPIDGERRIRVPSTGRLADLRARYARFAQNPSKVHRPPAGRSVLYRRMEHDKQNGAAQGVFGELIVLRKVRGPSLSLVSALSLTTLLRKAVMKHGPQPPPPFLSGHVSSEPESPPAREPHVAYAALAMTGSRYSEGECLGVALVLPRGLDDGEREACWVAAGRVQRLESEHWGRWEVELGDTEDPRVTLRPWTWTRESTVWSTVTPLVFDRYPKEPFGAEAEEIVRQSMTRAGLPEPSELDLHYNPWHLGVPKASRFPAASRAGRPPRYHCHVRVRFAVRVRGPVLAGAGRFYGYGLFRPHPEEG